jgi:hypothetical protein
MDKYSDRIVENITKFQGILCKKCDKMWYPEAIDINVKNKSVYYLRCLSCRISNNKAVRKHRSLKI